MNVIPPTDHGPLQDAMIVHVESDFEPLMSKFMTNR